MCCGRGIRAAASKQYALSPQQIEEREMAKTQREKELEAKVEKQSKLKLVTNPGAFHGNPIKRKSKKAAKVEKEEDVEVENIDANLDALEDAEG